MRQARNREMMAQNNNNTKGGGDRVGSSLHIQNVKEGEFVRQKEVQGKAFCAKGTVCTMAQRHEKPGQVANSEKSCLHFRHRPTWLVQSELTPPPHGCPDSDSLCTLLITSIDS